MLRTELRLSLRALQVHNHQAISPDQENITWDYLMQSIKVVVRELDFYLEIEEIVQYLSSDSVAFLCFNISCAFLLKDADALISGG